MAETVKIEVADGDPLSGFEAFARSIVSLDTIGAILIPQHLPVKNAVMPVLVSHPDKIGGIDPLAPAFALNAAKVVSRLTRRPAGETIAVMLRPCEIRAFVELVKLKQGRRENVLIISSDCLGAYANKDYLSFAETAGESPGSEFYRHFRPDAAAEAEGIPLAPACRVCEKPLPDGADVAIALVGTEPGDHLLAQALTEAGQTLLNGLDYPKAEIPEKRAATVAAWIAGREAARDRMMADTAAATDSLAKLTAYLAHCVNCYNCRVACPVCYCRECVFVTDVFDHEPIQYLEWAKRKGAVKMPTDTTFYHLTRLAHMSTACVGCGQCSNACPNDVPVMELFRTVAMKTQAAFGYEAGSDIDAKPPLTQFREDEFQEIVGIG